MKTIKNEKTVSDLNLEEFNTIWRALAKKHSHRAKIVKDCDDYIYFLQTFLLYFFIDKLGLSNEDVIAFKLVEEVEEVLNKRTSMDILTSLVWVGANQAIAHKEALKVDAYNTAMALYEEYTKDNIFVKNRTIREYKEQYKHINLILDGIDDIVYLIRLEEIQKKCMLSDKEIKCIQLALTIKLEESMQMSMEDCWLHQTTLVKKSQVKKAAMDTDKRKEGN